MDAFEHKRVNCILSIIGVNLLKLGNLHIKNGFGQILIIRLKYINNLHNVKNIKI